MRWMWLVDSGDRRRSARGGGASACRRPGRLEETPKPGDARLERSVTEIVASRRDAAAGAASAARSMGYHTLVIDEPVVGLAQAGPRLVEDAVRL